MKAVGTMSVFAVVALVAVVAAAAGTPNRSVVCNSSMSDAKDVVVNFFDGDNRLELEVQFGPMKASIAGSRSASPGARPGTALYEGTLTMDGGLTKPSPVEVETKLLAVSVGSGAIYIQGQLFNCVPR